MSEHLVWYLAPFIFLIVGGLCCIGLGWKRRRRKGRARGSGTILTAQDALLRFEGYKDEVRKKLREKTGRDPSKKEIGEEMERFWEAKRMYLDKDQRNEEKGL